MSIMAITLEKPKDKSKPTEINVSRPSSCKNWSDAKIRDMVARIFKNKFSMSPKESEVAEAVAYVSKSHFSEDSQIEFLLSAYVKAKNKFGAEVQVEATFDKDGGVTVVLREDDKCGNRKSLVGELFLSKDDLKEKGTINKKMDNKLEKIKNNKEKNNNCKDLQSSRSEENNIELFLIAALRYVDLLANKTLNEIRDSEKIMINASKKKEKEDEQEREEQVVVKKKLEKKRNESALKDKKRNLLLLQINGLKQTKDVQKSGLSSSRNNNSAIDEQAIKNVDGDIKNKKEKLT